MGQKLVIGPVNKGLKTDRLPFNIDNDSFPTLLNAYQWRGRVKRKRGTTLLGRLKRTILGNPLIGSTDGSGNFTGNLFTILIGLGLIFPAEIPSIVMGSIAIHVNGDGTYIEPSPADGTLSNGVGGTGTINYATGAITLLGSGQPTSFIHLNTFQYYPGLPVMGLEDLILTASQFPGTIAFDTTYAYNILTLNPYLIYDVSYYANPVSFGTYVQKTATTPLNWNGQDYRQFWTVNYEGALWATNGVEVPFTGSSLGMQFAPKVSIIFVSQTATTIVVTINGSPLVVGDFVFLNEWTASTSANAATLNFQTGYVTLVAGANITITLPNAALAADVYIPGIIQYLTNTSNPTKDCIRWYDGDPTNGSATAPVVNPGTGLGWVNFMPPLSQGQFSIADLPPAQYYLVGAKIIFPFKDRLLFLGPVVQSSSGQPIYLQDTIVYSENGTPYYTASFKGTAIAPTSIIPILTPPNIGGTNQIAFPAAWWEDQVGFGGFISAGLPQAINTVSPNENMLIVGFSTLQTRMAYTGNDDSPFEFYIINSELGSGSTFSVINMDQGVLARGNRGLIVTSQTSAQRIDLDIPDQIFKFALTNNGSERVCSQRDFINEWVYFTYVSNENSFIYPSQTLLYNYRDQSWGIFNESITTYGSFRRASGLTWNTLPASLSWEDWEDPWNSGSATINQPDVIIGNQQGFVLFRQTNKISEAPSLAIQNIASNIVTSPNHNLNNGDYIIINGVLGAIGAQVNGKIFKVTGGTVTTFTLLPPITTDTYLGGGTITRMYLPQIQTKQFPLAWDTARKTRIGPQQYLLSTTALGQIKLLIFLSMDNANAWNDTVNIPNGAIVYSTVLYTCPESTNLGLTPANINLQSPFASSQQQIWHRMNTSLLGDTVQLGFTMSDEQMRAFASSIQTFVITGATNTYPCILTCSVAGFTNNMTMVSVSGVKGMTQINYDGTQGTIYQVISSTGSTVTLNLNSSAFGTFTTSPDAILTVMSMPNQFEEIEIHGMILDVSPSSLLA